MDEGKSLSSVLGRIQSGLGIVMAATLLVSQFFGLLTTNVRFALWFVLLLALALAVFLRRYAGKREPSPLTEGTPSRIQPEHTVERHVPSDKRPSLHLPEDYIAERNSKKAKRLTKLYVCAIAVVMACFLLDLTIVTRRTPSPAQLSEVRFDYLSQGGTVHEIPPWLEQRLPDGKESELTKKLLSQPLLKWEDAQEQCTESELAFIWSQLRISATHWFWTRHFANLDEVRLLYSMSPSEDFRFDLQCAPDVPYLTLEDIEVTVHRYASVPPPRATASGPSDNRLPLIIVELEERSEPLPWVFHAKYLLDDYETRRVSEWRRASVTINDKLSHAYIVAIESKDRGFFTYTANVVVRAGVARGVSMPLVSEPRTVFFWGLNDEEVESLLADAPPPSPPE